MSPIGGGTSGADAPCMTTVPMESDMIVIDTALYSPPASVAFRNWGHPVSAEKPHHFIFPPDDPDRPRICWSPSDVDLLILHETTNDRTDPVHPVGMETRVVGVQFIVSRNGLLTQHNDIVEQMVHVPGFNDRSIGVEVANRVWTDDSEDPVAIPIGWGLGRTHYRVPPVDQLETVAALVQWVIDQPLLRVPPVWPQVSTLPDSGRPGFFMARTGASSPRYTRTTISGIVSHFVLAPSHSDGSFLALYTWLRLHGPDGLGIDDPVRAREEAKRIAQRPVQRAHHERILDLGL